MKNKLRYFVTTVVLMMAVFQPVNAVVVFDAKTDIISGKNSIIKDGITISRTDGDMWKNNIFNGDFSIMSSNKDIVMVGFKRPDCYYHSDWAINSFEFEHDTSSPKQKPAIKRIDNSGLWEEWSYDSHFRNSGYQDKLGYKVWKGMASELSCSFSQWDDSFDKIFVYFDGDELPQKNTFAVYEEVSDWYCGGEEAITTICYGYLVFLNEYSYLMEEYQLFTLPFYTDGNEQFWTHWSYEFFKEIIFDVSFAEYKPESTSKWFKGVKCEKLSTSNLNLSEVTNMSYMFENSTINILDLSDIILSNKPKVVTDMFLRSKIQLIISSENIQYEDNSFFVGVGTNYNPCYLDIPENIISQIANANESAFNWKGGMFRLVKEEPYVSCEKTNGKMIYTLRYDKNKIRYLSERQEAWGLDDMTNYEEYHEKAWLNSFNSNYDYGNDCYPNVSLNISPSFINFHPTSTEGWFSNCHAYQINGIENLYTSDVTVMTGMFIDSGLNNIDLSNFDTSNVTNMDIMFGGCSNLSSLDVSNFNTSKVTSMTEMFAGCDNLTTLDVSNFDTSNVTGMDFMFGGCSKLTSLDVSKFNTSNVIGMSGMFSGCNNLTTLDVSNFDTSNVTNMESMFSGCSNLTTLDVSNFDTSNVTNMESMFSGCINLTTLDVSIFNTSNVEYMSYMFDGCKSLTTLDLSNFDISKLENGRSNYMFRNCSSLKEIAISSTMGNLSDNAFIGVGTSDNPCEICAPLGFDFGTDTNQPYFVWKGGFFKITTKTVAVLSDNNNTLTFCHVANPNNYGNNIYSINTADTNPDWYNQRANITKVIIDPSFAKVHPTSTYGWFRGMENLEEIEGLEYLNTSETTLMSYMFSGCSKLKSIDVSHFDTKNAEKMGYMFMNCTNLESIDISNFDYSANTSCYRMFNGCTNLKNINTGEWTNNSNDQFGYMFSGCSSLETLDLSQLSLPSTAKTTSMLNSCRALRQLTISPSMGVLNSAACSGVGTASNPCDITAPDDFDFGVDTSAEPFRWKSGYFRLGSKLLAEASDVKYGNVYDLKISLRNGSHVYNGYQFNVHLPQGFYLTQKPRTGYEYTLSNRYTNTPTIRITPQDDGSYQVLAYAMDDVTITGTEGLIITLPLNVEEELAEGNYSGIISDITFNNPNNTSAFLQDAAFDIFVPAFGIGDVNHDRSINITDVMMTVNHVVGQTPAGFHIDDADVNGDNLVNISDIMAIVNLVINAPTANAPKHSRETMTDAITLIPNAQGYAVSLKNSEPYTALQMDIQLPKDAPLNARLSDNRSDGHTVICNDLGNGHYRIAIYSLNGHTIKGNDGILLQLQTSGKHNDIPEIYDVQLTNRLFESVKLSDISIPTDITIINDDGGDDSPAYNVQGIRAPKHHRGIIIQNGRKRVEKK